MLIAMAVAVRQALDYRGTLRAVGVCIIGWIITAILWLIFYLAGVPATGSIKLMRGYGLIVYD